MLTTDGSLPQQLGVVWSRLLEADSEGPSFISHAACARSVSSSRTFLSCACGALSISQQTLSRELRAMNYRKLSARPRHEEVCLSISQQTLSRELRAMNYRKLSARPRHEEVCLSISQQTLSRELRAMNYRKLSARPRHYAQNEHAADVFKKRSPTAWRRSQRRSAASRSRFGSRTRRGLDKRTRSRGAGPSAARAPQRLRISEQPRLISSARSVQPPAKELAWSCRAARHRAWNCT